MNKTDKIWVALLVAALLVAGLLGYFFRHWAGRSGMRGTSETDMTFSIATM